MGTNIYSYLFFKTINKLTLVVPICLLFILSLFDVSHSFVSQTTPNFYLSVGGCLLLAIVALIGKHKNRILRISAFEILFACFLLFSIGYGEYMGSLSTEWVISAFSLLLFYLLAIRIQLNTEWLFAGIVVLGLMEAIYGLGQYVHFFNNYVANFRMSGSFDNPAGFAAALSVAFPFALFLGVKNEIYWRLFGGVTSILFILAVVLSQSRTGVITIIVLSGLWFFKVFNLKCLNRCTRRTKILSSGILVIAILVGLYFVKKDSADGRLLVWQCSAQMIIDEPILGHGEGGFQREYMLYQADYFKNHPDSSYSILADIVKQPFNEFLLLIVEQGLVGGILLGLFLFYLIWEYRRSKSIETFYAMLCLTGIGTFACFSYPLSYPFIRLMAVFSATLIMKYEVRGLIIPQALFSFLKPAIFAICIGLLILSGKMFYDEYCWNDIAKRSLDGETIKVMPDYARLYKTMNRNGLFLYNYGAELNYIGEYNQSIALLNECANFYNDNDLQLLLADNYIKLKQYSEAEKCLLLAHQMIPNRFIPLYHLVMLYKKMGKDAEAYHLAQIITEKPIKVISDEVLTIKSEMRKMIENKNNM